MGWSTSFSGAHKVKKEIFLCVCLSIGNVWIKNIYKKETIKISSSVNRWLQITQGRVYFFSLVLVLTVLSCSKQNGCLYPSPGLARQKAHFSVLCSWPQGIHLEPRFVVTILGWLLPDQNHCGHKQIQFTHSSLNVGDRESRSLFWQILRCRSLILSWCRQHRVYKLYMISFGEFVRNSVFKCFHLICVESWFQNTSEVNRASICSWKMCPEARKLAISLIQMPKKGIQYSRKTASINHHART